MVTVVAKKEHGSDATAASFVSVPKRPRRFINLVIAGCLIVRFEIFLKIAEKEQCSASGIEVSPFSHMSPYLGPCSFV